MQQSLTWIRAYEASKFLFDDVQEWRDEDNEIVANRIVADAYHRKRKVFSFGSASKMPNPGPSSLALGTMLELFTWDVHKEAIRVFEFNKSSAPPLLWSWRHKACIAMPGRKLPPVTYKGTDFPKAYRLYRKWAMGKFPKGASKYKIPRIALSPPMIAVAISYRSDKFHDDGDFHNYIHHFEKGVLARVNPRGRGFFVNGGKLQLTKHGLHR